MNTNSQCYLGEKLYVELMHRLLHIESDESTHLWQKLSPDDREIWIGMASSYSEILASYDAGLELSQSNNFRENVENFAKSIYIDQMFFLKHHTDQESETMWNSLSSTDKELLMMMTSGSEV